MSEESVSSVQIRILKDGDAFGFQTFFDGSDHPASALCKPVYGLTPSHREGLTLGGDNEYCDWSTTFTPFASGWWVETSLIVHQPTDINPAMILWLGEMDHMDDRQVDTWRQTVLRGPTVNQQGLGGNDLPGCYLYDDQREVETVCFFPPESLGWAPLRLYNFAAREVIQYRPKARHGLGLIPNAPETAFRFAPGEYALRWWFTQRRRDSTPTPWQAQRVLIEAVAPLLDVTPALMSEPLPWAVVAQNALEDLHEEACWTTIHGVTGLRAYVLGSSAVARDEQPHFELMTQVDVLWPLLAWRQATGSARADGIIERLLATLPHYDRSQFNFVANSFPPHPRDSFMDTWYFLENALIKLPWIAYLTGDASLRAMFFRAMDGARALYDHTRGLMPLFADASDWQPRGSLLNAGVTGLYAAACVIASQMTGAHAYLTEAADALTTLHHLPPHLLTHEPQQLTFAAAAASFLAAHGFGVHWREVAADFVRLSLRMGYWGADPGVAFYDPRGMFQACASLGYPAYKENIETLLPWPELLAGGLEPYPADLMAAFANLQRRHNYAFFDPWLPTGLRRGPCPFIPYEDLATSEFPHSAKLGKELYGAGEVFWSALLFSHYAQTDSPVVLALALDVPCLELRPLPNTADRILLYNPDSSTREITLTTGSSQQRLELPARKAVLWNR